MSNRPGKIRLPTIQTPWEPVNRKDEPTLRYLVDVLRELERDKQDGADFSLSGATEGDILVANGSLVFTPRKTVPFSFGVGTNLSVTGNVVVTGNASIGGNLLATGTAAVTGNTLLKGTLGVSGLTTIGGALNVSGAAIVVGNHSVRGNLLVTGTATVTGDVTAYARLVVSGDPAASTTLPKVQIGKPLAAGDSDGTYFGINVPAGYAGDFLHFQVDGASVLRVDSVGRIGFNMIPSGLLDLHALSLTSVISRVLEADGTERFVQYSNGDAYWKGPPATALATSNSGPSFNLVSTYWNGAASVEEAFILNCVRYNPSAGQCGLWIRDVAAQPLMVFAGTGQLVSVGYDFPLATDLSTLGQFHVRSRAATTPAFTVQTAAGQSANAQSWRDSGGVVNAYVSNIFAAAFKPRDGATTTITTALLLGHNSSGTPDAGYGNEVRFQLKSSTTEDRNAGGLSYEWEVATEGSQIGLGRLTAYYITTPREVMQWGATSTKPKAGFLGAPAAVQQTGGAASAGAAYTATEQAMIQAAYDCLRTFGFLS